MPKVSGAFTVKIAPESMSSVANESSISRMSLDKQYSGALAASGRGEMLAFMNREIGSGGYVAMERVQGTLDGLHGSFLLQHCGTMQRGAPGLTVTVVPDSGQDELAGLRGSLQIRIEDGKHYYDFDYVLAAPEAG